MSYDGISVREVLNKINAPNGGWFLPQVQRQYVWGARYESEDYVCSLLDSLLRRYPIGGVVVWETESSVPYREFVRDYAPGQFARQVDEGRWSAYKSLVYDGQQRLQTLYSVLHHRFNDRVLHFDMLFNLHLAEADESGFIFRDSDAEPVPRYLRMTELVSKAATQKEKVALETRLMHAAPNELETQLTIRENLSSLWDVFVEINVKSIAYFPVKANTSVEVNEVFRRLNTGGMALSQIDLVLSKIKAEQSDYEEKLWQLSDKIKSSTGGIDFASPEILQFFHLLVKKTIRMDEAQFRREDVDKFKRALIDDAEPLVEVFQGYLAGLFNINSASIIPRWAAVLPIAAYFAARKRCRHEWRVRALPQEEIKIIHQYFILSQFCDWNTQTMVNAFSRVAIEAGIEGQVFPLELIRRVAIEKNRTADLHDYQLLGQPWLAAKVLMPGKTYVFHERKPQVDHIFPLNLAGGDDAYREYVDVLWNFQPIAADINNYKRARHPREFFNSEDGKKYWRDYDFIPISESPLWDNYRSFIDNRANEMRRKFLDAYGLSIIPRTD